MMSSLSAASNRIQQDNVIVPKTVMTGLKNQIGLVQTVAKVGKKSFRVPELPSMTILSGGLNDDTTMLDSSHEDDINPLIQLNVSSWSILGRAVH